MKPVIIISIVFLLLLPLSVFAQEESLSELAERLDAENLQKAQEQSGTNIQQQESFKKIDCPNGYIEKAISGGQIICVNEVTGQRLDESTTINFDEAITYTVIGVILIIVIIAGIAKTSSKESEPKSYKDIPRRNFSSDDEEQTLKNQRYKCNDCQTPIGLVKGRIVFYDYDHMDGDHYNNSPDNCQALCKNCHAMKTERERNMDRN